MNELDYASLEASKRLAEKGIVLETEKRWCSPKDGSIPVLVTVELSQALYPTCRYIPAPSIAEVWRELPEIRISTNTKYDSPEFLLTIRKEDEHTLASYDNNEDQSYGWSKSHNPTDALIDLLIWVKEQTNERYGG